MPKKASKKVEIKSAKEKPSLASKNLIECTLLADSIITQDSDAARELYNHNRYGTKKGKKVELSWLDAVYLTAKQKIKVKSGSKFLSEEQLIKKACKVDKKFNTKYVVYKDFRDKGYIIKTALKFGAEFRVYERGVKPGEDHAKWVVFPVKESETLTWHDFSAKNRVAHSTKKRLLIGCVDEEGDATYYEVRWIRP